MQSVPFPIRPFSRPLEVFFLLELSRHSNCLKTTAEPMPLCMMRTQEGWQPRSSATRCAIDAAFTTAVHRIGTPPVPLYARAAARAAARSLLDGAFHGLHARRLDRLQS